MTDSIIFDVDGTIWDTTPIVSEAWNKALDDLNLQAYHVNPTRLKGLFGLPMEAIIEDILPDQSNEVRATYKPLCYHYEEQFVGETGGILYPGMAEALEALSQKFPLYIVSNCQSGYIELMLRKTGFASYFSDFTCYGDNGLMKDANIRLIIERNNLCAPIYVGDTSMDEDACSKADVPFCFARYGFGTAKSPRIIIDSIGELYGML